MQYTFAGLMLSFSLAAAHAADAAWPELVGDQHASECGATLGIARASFRSSDFTLAAPERLPPDFGSKRVSGRDDADPPLLASADVFTRSPLPDMPHRGMYWQTQAVRGQRLVMEEVWSAMHDKFDLLAIDASLDQTAFIALRELATYKAASTLFDTEIQVPQVFQKAGAGDLWAMDTGSNYDFLPSWTVYGAKAGRYQRLCEIRFRPEARRAVLLLPGPVQRLSALLEQAAGPNLGRHGTFNHVFVSAIGQMWANAALRPWVGPPEIAGSRRHVDRNLKKWSRRGPLARDLYMAIQAQLPLARQALAAHYKISFDMRDSDATAKAGTWIDRAYRSHFMFPDG